MKEPKFSDAPCYGVEFDPYSKVCRVCIANRSCQRLVRKAGLFGKGATDFLLRVERLRRPNQLAVDAAARQGRPMASL